MSSRFAGLIPKSEPDYLLSLRNGVGTSELLGQDIHSEVFKSYCTQRNLLIESDGLLILDSLRVGVRSFLKELKRAGFEVHLLSGRFSKLKLEKQLIALKIEEFFSEINVVSPFYNAEDKAEQLDKIFNLTAYVGDTPKDIQAAKLAGVNSIGMTGGLASSERLVLAEPKEIFQDFSMDLMKYILSLSK